MHYYGIKILLLRISNNEYYRVDDDVTIIVTHIGIMINAYYYALSVSHGR